MILAEKVAQLRKQQGWSQEDLAQRLEVSRQSVSKWELGASIPDLDKIVKMSTLFGVSTDYLLKDELELAAQPEEVSPPPEAPMREETPRRVSLEEANAYLDTVRNCCWKIALSVFFCILSPTPLIMLGGLAEYGPGGISDERAGGLGVAVLLIILAVAVVALILNGMKLSRFEYLEKEWLSLEYGVQGILERDMAAYEPVFRRAVAGGVALCILGVVPMMLLVACDAGDLAMVAATDVLLLFVACGVFLFVHFGMLQESYKKLLQMEDYTREEKRISKRLSPFSGGYWCVVTALYLGVSLTRNNWEISWIIWPVAGVLFAAVWGILRGIVKAREGR